MRQKRILCVLLALAAVAFVAGPALAVITGTSHDVATGNKSQCSVCHIPHGGAGARLWPVAPTTGAQFVGVVSTLCASCHFSTGAYGAAFAAGNSDLYVYGAFSHGVQMTIAQIPQGSTLTTSGFPYTGQAGQTPPTGGVIECTSCHNVHEDINRPFLRASLNTICQRCHSNRNYQSATDSSGSGATFGAAGTAVRYTNPGSHPVGTDITGDVTVPGNSPITFPSASQVIISPTANNWGLGGHRTTDGDTGGVGCNTCHAVHGVQADTGETTPPADLAPTLNMLIFAQASTGAESESAPAGRSVANGDGAFNRFCEECHTGPDPAGYGLANSNPNPGGTSFGHPVDAMAAQYNAGVANFWGGTVSVPAGGGFTAGANVDPIPICESCHTPHPAANNPNRASIQANAGPFILRDAPATVCTGCHPSSFAGHHPVGQDISAAVSGAGAAAYLASGYVNFGTTLGCGTCHTNGGAHNWTAGGGAIGLNVNWRPVGNGRDFTTPTNDQFVGTGTGTSYYTSTTCMDCHYAFQNRNADPSNGVAVPAEAGFTDLGRGTHYLGPFAFNSAALSGGGVKTYRGGSINGDADVNIATNTNTWPYGGWSRFGGTSGAPVLVCESCHELEPDKNGGTAHALLAPYVDGLATNQDYADFCEGCHGVPTGTHPMTADTVGRTGVVLSTGAAPWIRAAAPTELGGTSTWATNQMSCDSCHQPHAAPTTGGTLIIEGPAANVLGGTTVPISLGLVAGNGGVVAYRVTNAVGTLPNFSRFCDQCHSYLQ